MARLGRSQPFKPVIQGIFTSIVNFRIDVDAGSYLFTGTNATLEHDKIIIPSAGSYSWTGTDVDFIVTAALSRNLTHGVVPRISGAHG